MKQSVLDTVRRRNVDIIRIEEPHADDEDVERDETEVFVERENDRVKTSSTLSPSDRPHNIQEDDRAQIRKKYEVVILLHEITTKLMMKIAIEMGKNE